MIRKAHPKQGLETGGLISGSEAARARIAAEYEPDLSGANGPTARFDTLRELIGTEIGAAQNEMTFASGDGSQIFGRGGRFAAVAPSGKRTKAGGSGDGPASSPQPWDLVLLDPGAGTWGIYAPRVIYSREDVTATVSITNSGFSLSAGDLVVATMAGDIDTFLATPTITLEALSTWDGHPSAYKFGTASPYAWENSRIPVWSISSTDSDGAVQLTSGLYGTKLIGSHPTLAYTLAEVPLQNRIRVVPMLL